LQISAKANTAVRHWPSTFRDDSAGNERLRSREVWLATIDMRTRRSDRGYCLPKRPETSNRSSTPGACASANALARAFSAGSLRRRKRPPAFANSHATHTRRVEQRRRDLSLDVANPIPLAMRIAPEVTSGHSAPERRSSQTNSVTPRAVNTSPMGLAIVCELDEPIPLKADRAAALRRTQPRLGDRRRLREEASIRACRRKLFRNAILRMALNSEAPPQVVR